ncbi:MAG TPA: ABC transporter permease [Gaiellaceae bacterium]|nr:ABC transporter permease [Gaiellaceae bacterium]
MKQPLLLLRKDLLVLRRSPLLLGVLVAYPLVIALLIGLTAAYANAKPRVALVDLDGIPPRVVVAGRTFDVDALIDQVAKNVELVRMHEGEATRQLAAGRVAAVITVPAGFVADLTGLLASPHLTLATGTGGITPRVRQQMQALVYNLNLHLQKAFIQADIRYVDLLLHGGKGVVLGHSFSIIGLDGAGRLLARLPPSPERAQLEDFVHDARLALALTDNAIRATATPIVLDEERGRGRTSALSAQVQSYGLAITICFLGLMLAAGSLAAERDENVIGRLVRGLVGLGRLIAAKVALATVVAVVLGLAILVGFGIAVEAGGVAGGEPWHRLPLVLAGVALAGIAVGAAGALVGALARESRTASLVGILAVLPVVFLGLVPREIVPVAYWISDAFPFAHAARFFASSLYDPSPWGVVGREAAWLVGLGAACFALARLSARRLSA